MSMANSPNESFREQLRKDFDSDLLNACQRSPRQSMAIVFLKRGGFLFTEKKSSIS